MNDIANRNVTSRNLGTFVARQAIVDRRGQVAAYELLFRDGPVSSATIRNDFCCTAEVVERAVGGIGLDVLLGGLDGYINCSLDFLQSSILDLLPAERFVLEVLETCVLDDQLKRRCEVLREAGFRIALDDVPALTPGMQLFLPVVDVIKLEWPAIAPADRQALVSRLKAAGKLVLAEKVDSRLECEIALNTGCDFVQGFFFSQPQLFEGRRTIPDLGAVMEILALLAQDIIDHRILHALSRSPILVAQLLRIANCASGGRSDRSAITSLHQALSIAGTTRLFQWCSLLLFNNPDGSASDTDPLVALSTQRASFMKRVAESQDGATPAFAYSAYLTGMLSLLHVVYGQEQAIFLQDLSVAPAIKAALLSRSGALGQLLSDAEVFERGGIGSD